MKNDLDLVLPPENIAENIVNQAMMLKNNNLR